MKNLSVFLPWLLVSNLGIASVENTQTREDELFGEPKSLPQVLDTGLKPPAKASETVFGKEQVDVGGRLEGSLTTSQMLNQKFLDAPTRLKLQGDLAIEAKQSDEMKGLLRLRFSELNSGQSESNGVQGAQKNRAARKATAEIDEAWLKFNTSRSVFYTIGKQHIKWGSSRFWNPTDFMAREHKDPFAIFDSRLGIWLLKMHYPVESTGSNFYVLANFDEAPTLRQMRFSARLEQSLGGVAEVALTVAAGNLGPNKFGVDLSSGVGPIDVTIEAAVSARNQGNKLSNGSFESNNIILPQVTERGNEKVFELVAGASYSLKYSDNDSVTLGGEFYLNGFGYSDKSNELFALATQNTSYLSSASRYAAGYVRLPNPGNWNSTNFTLSTIANLVDKSTLVRLGVEYELGTRTTIEFSYGHCFGTSGELCFALPQSTLSALANSPAAKGNENLLKSIPTQPTANTASLSLATVF